MPETKNNMKENNQEIIKNNLSLLGKLFELEYLYVLLAFVLSLDIYLIFEFGQSILSVDFVSIINHKNIKYLIQYIISFGFMVSLVIPVIKFGIYKVLFKIIGRITLGKINKQQESSSDYIRVHLLYREALLEKDQYKLNRVNEYYKHEKEVRKITNVVTSVVIFLLIDLLIGKNDSMSLCRQLLNQLSIMSNKIIKCTLWGTIGLFLYASMLILAEGYNTMWNDLVLYPKNEK